MIAHGTRRGYQYAKCRCELCRQWMRDAAKVRRDKARAAQPSQWIAPEPVAAHIRTQLANGWPAYLRADDYVRLQDGRAVCRWSRQIVTVQWGDLVALMVEAGY